MLKIDPVALTDVGRKRDHNEDYLGDMLIRSGRSFGEEKLKEKGYLFAVADGMGGHASGEVASELAITTLFNEYYNGPNNGSIPNELARAVQLANFQVHHAGTAGGRGQMGTTLTLALIKENQVLVGNVGDSRTYLIRQGVPLRLTRDHSLVQEQIEMGALTPEQAKHSLIKNVITRAIGNREEVEADFFDQEVQAGDILLLCSDGLHGLVEEPEMGAIVASTPDLKEAAQHLINLANERGGPDNISVVLIRILEVGEPIPAIMNAQGTARLNLEQPTAPLIPAIAAADAGQHTAPAGKPVLQKTAQFPAANLENKVTDKFKLPVQEPPAKESRAGAVIISLVLLFLVVAGLIFFLINNNSTANTGPATTSPLPTVTVAPLPTATITPALTRGLPTLAPANNGGTGLETITPTAPFVVGAPTTVSGGVIRATPRAAGGSSAENPSPTAAH